MRLPSRELLRSVVLYIVFFISFALFEAVAIYASEGAWKAFLYAHAPFAIGAAIAGVVKLQEMRRRRRIGQIKNT